MSQFWIDLGLAWVAFAGSGVLAIGLLMLSRRLERGA